MNSNDIANLANIIMGIAVIFVWITVLLMILIGAIFGKIYKRNFFKAVKEIIDVKEFNSDICLDGIKNSYDVYRSHRFGFASIGIIPICQEMSSNLRCGKWLDSIKCKPNNVLANRLDEIIKRLQYEKNFDDEKANEIIDELKGKVETEDLMKVKQRLTFLEAYHKGVLSVKNTENEDLKDKMKRKTLFATISGIIGIFGSIASIITFIQ